MVIETNEGELIGLNPRQAVNLVLAQRFYAAYCKSMAQRTRDTGYKKDYLLQASDASGIADMLEGERSRTSCVEFEYATVSSIIGGGV